jgi:hypothetical protein
MCYDENFSPAALPGVMMIISSCFSFPTSSYLAVAIADYVHHHELLRVK